MALHREHLLLEVLTVVSAQVVNMDLTVLIPQDYKLLSPITVLEGEELRAGDASSGLDEVPFLEADKLIVLF